MKEKDIEFLKQGFWQLCGHSNSDLSNQFWMEIHSGYSEEGRHYHDLHHLHYLLKLWDELKEKFDDAEAVAIAIYYHDLIYDARRKDNEERSAEIAVERLQALGWKRERIERVEAHILATSSHESSEDSDRDLLLDLDLGILSEAWEVYSRYAAKIRKEYAVYPDRLYVPGRIQVLQHFLGMERIYKSPEFQSEREAKARENLSKELEELLKQNI